MALPETGSSTSDFNILTRGGASVSAVAACCGGAWDTRHKQGLNRRQLNVAMEVRESGRGVGPRLGEQRERSDGNAERVAHVSRSSAERGGGGGGTC